MHSACRFTAVLLLVASASCARATTSSAPVVPTDDALTAIARQWHDRVMTLDTHVDFDPINFEVGQLNYSNRLSTQVDLTKMEEGGLDAVFFSIYVGQGTLDAAGYERAYATDTAKFNAVHRLAEQIAPNRIAIAYSAADARRIYASGKKVAFMGVENGYGIGTDITRVKEFHDRGARYMSLSHNGHSQLSDSNTGEATGEWLHGGLSPLGKQVIVEMNRLGMMIDISHPSKQSMMQTLTISKAPIMASHSAVRAICNHSRNLDDEQLRALAKNGGVVQVVAFRAYLKCDRERDVARTAAMTALNEEFGITPGARGAGAGAVTNTRRAVAGTAGPSCAALRATASPASDPRLAELTPERREAYLQRQRAITERYPAMASVTVKDFVDHIDYAVKLIGLDHVGISSDFDGGGGVDGFSCALEAMNVTKELVRRGYTEEQVKQIWSGNLLRVLERVERIARDMR